MDIKLLTRKISQRAPFASPETVAQLSRIVSELADKYNNNTHRAFSAFQRLLLQGLKKKERWAMECVENGVVAA
jgi:hypothetical protein